MIFEPDSSPAPRDRVERKSRSRGRTNRGLVRRIDDTAKDRQAAWLETGQPFTTARLGGVLDELFDERRDDQARAQ